MKPMKVLLCAAVMSAVQAAGAVPLVADTLVSLPGTDLSASPKLDGTTLEDDIVDFSFTAGGGTFSGTVESQVVRSDSDGTLDFYWRVSNDGASDGAISTFRLSDFFSKHYNADWRSDSVGDTAPTGAKLFSAPGNVHFVFGDALLPGSGSYLFFLDTDAKSYGKTAHYDLLTPFSGRVGSALFATYAPVPEPSTVALMLAGLLAVGIALRRPAR